MILNIDTITLLKIIINAFACEKQTRQNAQADLQQANISQL